MLAKRVHYLSNPLSAIEKLKDNFNMHGKKSLEELNLFILRMRRQNTGMHKAISRSLNNIYFSVLFIVFIEYCLKMMVQFQRRSITEFFFISSILTRLIF
jgi:hypothetical protein